MFIADTQLFKVQERHATVCQEREKKVNASFKHKNEFLKIYYLFGARN